ncbi:tyrosine-type recombinase/integrase [Sulfitobacter mediterraneus]|uniref:tyrosine-type recombinase/integrase n=1 Tax=Sulfitobacter mediterraneus TaxID=83219 RepID=UPI0019346E31|nr:integrase arm-type DNA-binding domain-containing protein [Sulfitobacter mediterraneus]MBM1310351.1 tyrosine-type recombinase/integrase [Sulfitobacter mediterraneus]MBM1314235.1 tyrosine-type recombinase/integrase [Sulfitobacter mediterraneus]MBM1322595.1 tyrosine-type recombinase/integrase [Sulfitobacter mediterraneus]MBM1326507.1 tyrosine-type recombinase/integrase [Sulfitobacter mediterraneus]MBM1397853.1 tyrosine-type recombinase/integrase [Sulfitobacter mediterraneus]
MALTDLKIKKAASREKPYKLSDGGGLFLLVKPNRSKLWQQKYRHFGKERLLSHGAYPDVTLQQARLKREEARKLIAQGGDPALEKRLAKIEAETQARNTFLLVGEELIQQAYDRDLADATIRKKIWHVHTLAEALHHRPVNEITSAEILDLLKKVEHSGRRETAKKLRGTISAVFRLAIVTLRAENDPTQAVKGALLPIKVTNRAAITDEKVFGQFLRDLEAYTGAGVIKDALLFQILTMTRRGEVRGAKQHEFDLDNATWTIPAERMKMRRDHVVPLSKQALELVHRNWIDIRGVELLFPSLNSNRKWLSENAFNSAMRRMGYSKEEVTAHGFRATASTVLNTHGYEGDVIEAALAHQDQNAIRRTYNRATYWDQRVRLMQSWADLCFYLKLDEPA